MKDNGAVQEAVTKDVTRYQYDLSNFSMQVLKIGSLQTFFMTPVCAGDSLQVQFDSVFRLAPLRRYLYMDARIDLFAFYVPHRHVYGDDWVDFIKAGIDEGVTLGTDTLQAGIQIHCCGFRSETAEALPRWALRPYIQIWNRYFRDPSDVAGTLDEDYWSALTDTADQSVHVGLQCCHLKRMWNTALLTTVTTADYRLPLDGGEVDLLNLSALQGRYKTEQQRDWFDLRYADIVNDVFGAGYVNIDADKRPELLAHTVQWMSGYDVDGTADATFGNYIGKGQGLGSIGFPWRLFQEHGTVWIMGLVRFPAVHTKERHFLLSKAEPTYLQISGDPEAWSRQAPYALNANELFVDSGSVALGSIPYGQWYRESPPNINLIYELIAGHPFLTDLPTSRNEAVYIAADAYDQVFETLQLYHVQTQGWCDVLKRSYVPDPRASIFAGTGIPGAA